MSSSLIGLERILSAKSNTSVIVYFNLAKWLEEKLKLLSVNKYAITDVFFYS